MVIIVCDPFGLFPLRAAAGGVYDAAETKKPT
jgi:hypothetical protein